MRGSRLSLVLLVATTGFCTRGGEDEAEIQVAVASNFADPMRDLAGRFAARTDYRVTLSVGSTGKHYAMIQNGAPFDAFFAADVRRPELLERAGLAQPDTRFTYAVGKLVLWSTREGLVDAEARILEHGDFHRLALAHPELAPYGAAAQEYLEAQGLWESLRGKVVRGENIGQAFQFVQSANAELGFVAYSQVKRPGRALQGSLWEVPQEFYTPIEQQAVLLNDDAGARAFLMFVQSDAAQQIIQDYGYQTP